jgi:hypothetical protein
MKTLRLRVVFLQKFEGRHVRAIPHSTEMRTTTTDKPGPSRMRSDMFYIFHYLVV